MIRVVGCAAARAAPAAGRGVGGGLGGPVGRAAADARTGDSFVAVGSAARTARSKPALLRVAATAAAVAAGVVAPAPRPSANWMDSVTAHSYAAGASCRRRRRCCAGSVRMKAFPTAAAAAAATAALPAAAVFPSASMLPSADSARPARRRLMRAART